MIAITSAIGSIIAFGDTTACCGRDKTGLRTPEQTYETSASLIPMQDKDFNPRILRHHHHHRSDDDDDD
ncbi:hypothetical protein JG687_00003864 [Phytophthora cactorum]|uniref:Uncharacterized protein n=2 Tax=Phytophthora TaxID=4783 RepID=A0A8J5JAW3_9STRA|nr:hypothetical protein GQ600_24674 [Phytophthora cactorum]KAG6966731.1 hypothetical protein JG688_00006634 [Phytophthora aleatoria]KAG6968252.1 hypothetical protein JG687_00003864 [Phytophthora cactorum]